MTADLLPLRLLLLTPAGWVNRHQQHVIDYLIEEKRVLREQLRGGRIRLTDDQRRRLAAKGQRLGRRVLRQVPNHRDAGHEVSDRHTWRAVRVRRLVLLDSDITLEV